jgi:hypothetical protein
MPSVRSWAISVCCWSLVKQRFRTGRRAVLLARARRRTTHADADRPRAVTIGVLAVFPGLPCREGRYQGSALMMMTSMIESAALKAS